MRFRFFTPDEEGSPLPLVYDDEADTFIDEDGDPVEFEDGQPFEPGWDAPLYAEDGRRVFPPLSPDEVADQQHEAYERQAEDSEIFRAWFEDQQERQDEAEEGWADLAEETERIGTELALEGVEERKSFNRELHRDIRETERAIGRTLDAEERDSLIGYVERAREDGDENYNVGTALSQMYPDGAPERTRVEEVAQAIADDQMEETGGLVTRATARSQVAATGEAQNYSITTVTPDPEGNRDLDLVRVAEDE